jgi:hypothetical protein
MTPLPIAKIGRITRTEIRQSGRGRAEQDVPSSDGLRYVRQCSRSVDLR